jgi:hypothetical protein
VNPEIKQRWLDALRSGKYNQGTGFLRRKDNEFCCLGVLCDVVKDQTRGEWVEPYDGFDDYNVTGPWTFADGDGEHVDGYPSDLVYEVTGLDRDLAGALAGLNDAGDDFEYIADRIEEQA